MKSSSLPSSSPEVLVVPAVAAEIAGTAAMPADVAAASASAPVATVPSQGEAVYDSLRNRILTLALRPGERLTERALEGLVGGSRTPIRAALSRLEADALVRRDPRGWTVAPIDTDELTELAEYREALETRAVRLACERAPDGEIAAVSERLDRVRDIYISLAPQAKAAPQTQWRDQWHRAGTDFHIEIARLSGNRFFIQGIERVMIRLARVRWLEVQTPERCERSWQEHREILDAIAARDIDAAVQATSAHIGKTRERLLDSLREDRHYLRAAGLAVVGSSEQ